MAGKLASVAITSDVTEAIPHLVWSAHTDGRCDYLNRRYLEFVGISSEAARRRVWFDDLHPADRPVAAAAWADACATGGVLRDEYRLRRAADGAWIWHAAHAVPVRDREGAIVGWAGTFTEIHQRRPFGARLGPKAAELERVYATLPVGLCLLERDLRILRVNERMAALDGVPLVDHLGARLSELLPDVAAALGPLVEKAFAGDEPVLDVEVAVKTAGDVRHWLVSVAPMRDAAGRVAAASVALQDVTDRKRAEERMHQASHQKDQFLATLGHELRNPLAAIRSAAEVLELRCSEDSTLERVQSILDRQSAHMATLLDGLLDVSRIIRGKISLEKTELDLCSVIREVIEDRGKWLHRRGIELALELPDRELPLHGDRVRLAQVVDNLLSNAMAFTPAGGRVTVRVRPGEVRAAVIVEDTGAGITADLLPVIFEPFRQGEPSVNRRAGGLGLGLALVKGLAELHGGSVEVESEGPGRGSRFTVWLPLAAALPAPAPAPRERASPGGQRLLIVEDHRDTALVMSDVLEASGYRVSVAFDGKRALELARETEPDVVLCDIGLPGGMSGYDVAAALRSEPQLRRVYLVALTGYGGTDERDRAVRAGFDAHLTKPVRLQAIEDLLVARRQ